MNLSASDISAIVVAEIDHYQPQGSDSTVGVPWSERKVAAHVEMLKQCLVPPRLESFTLAENYEQVTSKVQTNAEYWVVAEHGGYVEWYDPGANEFGLGKPSTNGTSLVSIGVRGDLVGVFCAM
jgi:hypothetical protein